MKKRNLIVIIICLIILSAAALVITLTLGSKKTNTTCDSSKIKKANNSQSKAKTNPQIPVSSNKPTTKNEKINTVGNTSGNILNGGYAAQQGNWVYFNCKGLCKAMLDMKTGWKRICDDAEPLNINVIGDYVYYTNMNNLYRISTNGENKTKLSEDNVRNLIVTSTDLYYINNADDKIYKMNLNTNSKAALSDGFCSRFTLDKDWIFYTAFSPQDNSSVIYKIKLDGSNKTKLVTTKCNYVISHNDFLYFVEFDMETITIFRSTLDSSNKEKLYDDTNGNLNFLGNYLLYIDRNNTLKKINTNNLNENTSIELNKHSILSDSNILVIDNYILLHNPINNGIYKINTNGTIEQISNYK